LFADQKSAGRTLTKHALSLIKEHGRLNLSKNRMMKKWPIRQGKHIQPSYRKRNI